MVQLKLNSNPLQLNWQNQESYIFLNSRLSEAVSVQLVRACEKFFLEKKLNKGYLILASSGTTQADAITLKFIKKENFLAAAQSFNSFFDIVHEDVFLQALPIFHVGGLAAYARSYLAGCKLIETESTKWHPEKFRNDVESVGATRVSLVPTQVFDLVKMNLKASKSLDTVFVGGAHLSSELRDQALDLGWPLLASYGMTETSSMLASQKYSSRRQKSAEAQFVPLPGVEFRTDSQNKVFIRAPGVLSYALSVDLRKGSDFTGELKTFDESTELETQDYGYWDGEYFKYLGREQDLIKISGELVSLARLRSVFNEGLARTNSSLMERLCLLSLPHSRNENEIVLASVGVTSDIIDLLIKDYNKVVMPFEKIKRYIMVKSIPRTDLGKVLVNQLKNEILEGQI
ncbi:MAG: AMP-binding protein [Bdellovibrionota bacterium]